MGIKGFKRVYDFSMFEIDLVELKGLTVGVDAASWLYNGCLPIAKEILEEGIYPASAIEQVVNMVKVLRDYEIKPILVFDGDALPIKEELYKEKDSDKAGKLNDARVLEENGQYEAAQKAYQEALKVGRDIPHLLMERLRTEDIDFRVAMYEADAQLAYMAKTGDIKVVITVDHDLIVYGCERIIYNLNMKTGRGIEYRKDRLEEMLQESGFTWEMFVQACIFSGCDYLKARSKNLKLEKALTLMHKHKCYQEVITCWEKGGVKVPDHYRESFRKALLTYKHQWVFDEHTGEMVHLSPILDGEEMDFLGKKWSNEIASGIAYGNLHPNTKESYNKLKRKVDSRTDQLDVRENKKKLVGSSSEVYFESDEEEEEEEDTKK